MRPLILALLLAAPTLALAAPSTAPGAAHAIGKVIGFALFAWLVLKIINRNKD